MGWWLATKDGESLVPGGSLSWGDGPADIMDDALEQIDKVFLSERGRRPTKDELLAGLKFSLRGGPWEAEMDL